MLEITSLVLSLWTKLTLLVGKYFVKVDYYVIPFISRWQKVQ